MVSGSCLCGAIAFEAWDLSPQMAHCHCSMCRKFHGAAFATFGEALKTKFRWLRGEDQLSTFEAPNGTKRKFCKVCGSSLIFVPSKENDWVEFALGCLDTPLELRPDANIFTAYKAEWFEITDGLPQFPEGRKES